MVEGAPLWATWMDLYEAILKPCVRLRTQN